MHNLVFVVQSKGPCYCITAPLTGVLLFRLCYCFVAVALLLRYCFVTTLFLVCFCYVIAVLLLCYCYVAVLLTLWVLCAIAVILM